ncbi:AMP-dependent synthetase [Bdellovibrio sp. ZAP7]|uniref:AMP-binding protein n=1 Tax=Bdellovibrio sp. ZAP7 TaxID=2231053 RepID=UPI00115A012F|nr:AMP-binding protein [Bdellovibrio sp. ZAP7]QDK44063.1 AMP-dependent synthetase [Bdellovibrio sp. ZAP7]
MALNNEFKQARDFLILHRADYDYATREFKWPELTNFNWALDYFDPMAEGNNNLALWIMGEDGREEKYSFADISARSSQVANYLRRLGLKRGDHVLLYMGNETALWELMLACMKLGAVMIPTSPLVALDELQDRLVRGDVKLIATTMAESVKFDVQSPTAIKLTVDGKAPGWEDYSEATRESANFEAEGETKATDPLLLYFTSGTTAKPKLVEHTHQSYPVGHLSTMFWIGLRPGDIHLNVSSPGWAKHAWSSFFAPWNAEATVFIHKQQRFDAQVMLETLEKKGVTSVCAPPTVWRMLAVEDLGRYKIRLREAVSAGEPLDAEIIRKFQEAWDLTIRDGYGQTETTAQIGNSPGQKVHPGTMGKPLPGYRITLLDRDNNPGPEGEICIDLTNHPLGVMNGYRENDIAQTPNASYYRTGDMAARDEHGCYTFVGRGDDIFKCSDYRVSPFEVESVLLEHPAVREVAVIPSPHPLRQNVPKAIIFLAKGMEPTRELALQILNHSRSRLTPFKRIRRVEFSDLPKTTSGKIRRVELRVREQKRVAANEKSQYEFWEEDFKAVLPDTWSQDLP